MKMRSILIGLALGTGLIQAQAQDVDRSACAALICMSGLNGAAPHECKPYVEDYFEIRVYKKGTFSTKFEPAKTAKKRHDTLLSVCEGAKQKDIDAVTAKFGFLEYSPFLFN